MLFETLLRLAARRHITDTCIVAEHIEAGLLRRERVRRSLDAVEVIQVEVQESILIRAGRIAVLDFLIASEAFVWDRLAM